MQVTDETVAMWIDEKKVSKVAGVTAEVYSTWGLQLIRNKCNRCLTTEPDHFASHECLLCQKHCVYCRHCIQMGKIASCTELLIGNDLTPIPIPEATIQLSYALSPSQSRAAEEWIESYQKGKSHLLHAVCGAGKTEIMMKVIESMLQQQLRVCVASPRTDVIIELWPRFQKAFPQLTVHAHFGGAPIQDGNPHIVLATTHQLYHYVKAFDHILVDEADAFPYSIDRTLLLAVEKALLTSGSIHYISATPTPSISFDSESVIARRFHGYSLPEPRFEKLLGYKIAFQKGKIPSRLEAWITNCENESKPYLIFFPTIRMMSDFPGKYLRVHAEHPDRKEHIQLLKDKKIKGLLTTTILERGITIENLQVAVVGAEQPLFTQQALIQIAGRVGRSQRFPEGDVVFFHQGITDAMIAARKTIRQYNQS